MLPKAWATSSADPIVIEIEGGVTDAIITLIEDKINVHVGGTLRPTARGAPVSATLQVCAYPMFPGTLLRRIRGVETAGGAGQIIVDGMRQRPGLRAEGVQMAMMEPLVLIRVSGKRSK